MGCAPVLSAANGPVPASVMFVGEAPGRFGAAKTGVPFSGDMAGKRFEILLAAAGLVREDVFVTNAVVCLPLDTNGRNRPPRAGELRECAGWLRATVECVEPRVVVAMGRVALDALKAVSPHTFDLSHEAGTIHPWVSRRLAVVYHPAARSQVHRPWAAQVDDWRKLGVALRSSGS
jgi:uracil-DNA glycosylase family 4